MARIVETTVYQFDELSEQAKDKARQWYREASAGDNYFSESVIEDAATIAELFGLTINKRKSQPPAINWSGFASQGDGASFEGTYYSKSGGLDAVKAYAPTDKKLHAIVADLEASQGKLLGKIAGTITTSGRYSHSHSMNFEFEIDDSDSDQEIPDETIKAMKQAFRDYADWIYRNLENEYVYYNSDEQIDETMRANEYQFLETGKIF